MKPRIDERVWRWALGLLVFAAAVTAFAPAVQNGFVVFDDPIYIINVLGIRGLGWANLRWMLTATDGCLWQPVTWLSFAIDYHLWGLEPWGFHFTNIALHAVAAVLFYRVCLVLFARARPEIKNEDAAIGAALSALFFALHPLRVESVAWAVERKDTLSAVFLFAAVLARLAAVDARGVGRFAWEAAGLAMFALALSAKVSAVTLPAVLLILEVYPLRRLPADPRRWRRPPLRPIVFSTLPYFIVAAGGFALSLSAAAKFGIFYSIAERGIAWRLGQVFYGLVFYARKTIWPSGLAPYYPPRPWFGSWSGEFFGCAVLVLAAAAMIWRGRRRLPGLAAAAACYGVMLIPMSGISQQGALFSACDRYSYLPCLSLAVLFGAMFLRAGRPARALAAAGLALLGLASWRQCPVWRDSIALWSAADSRAPSAFAASNLGVALFEAGRFNDGLNVLEKCVALHPEDARCYDGLGGALRRLGRRQDALSAWRRGLARQDSAEINLHLGAMLAEGDGAAVAEALPLLQAAVKHSPFYAPWRVILADALTKAGRMGEAEAQYAAAIGLDPRAPDAQTNWGSLLAMEGKADEAVVHYRLALYLSEGRAEAHYDWGNSMLAADRLDAAERHYREALRLEPKLAQAQVNLGNVLARRGRMAEATARYRAALRIDPGLSGARANLSAVLQALGR